MSVSTRLKYYSISVVRCIVCCKRFIGKHRNIKASTSTHQTTDDLTTSAPTTLEIARTAEEIP